MTRMANLFKDRLQSLLCMFCYCLQFLAKILPKETLPEVYSTFILDLAHGGDFSRQERSYSKTRLFANLANIIIMRDQWEEKHGGFEESESSSKYLR